MISVLTVLYNKYTEARDNSTVHQRNYNMIHSYHEYANISKEVPTPSPSVFTAFWCFVLYMVLQHPFKPLSVVAVRVNMVIFLYHLYLSSASDIHVLLLLCLAYGLKCLMFALALALISSQGLYTIS